MSTRFGLLPSPTVHGGNLEAIDTRPLLYLAFPPPSDYRWYALRYGLEGGCISHHTEKLQFMSEFLTEGLSSHLMEAHIVTGGILLIFCAPPDVSLAELQTSIEFTNTRTNAWLMEMAGKRYRVLHVASQANYQAMRSVYYWGMPYSPPESTGESYFARPTNIPQTEWPLNMTGRAYPQVSLPPHHQKLAESRSLLFFPYNHLEPLLFFVDVKMAEDVHASKLAEVITHCFTVKNAGDTLDEDLRTRWLSIPEEIREAVSGLLPYLFNCWITADDHLLFEFMAPDVKSYHSVERIVMTASCFQRTLNMQGIHPYIMRPFRLHTAALNMS